MTDDLSRYALPFKCGLEKCKKCKPEIRQANEIRLDVGFGGSMQLWFNPVATYEAKCSTEQKGYFQCQHCNIWTCVEELKKNPSGNVKSYVCCSGCQDFHYDSSEENEEEEEKKMEDLVIKIKCCAMKRKKIDLVNEHCE